MFPKIVSELSLTQNIAAAKSTQFCDEDVGVFLLVYCSCLSFRIRSIRHRLLNISKMESVKGSWEYICFRVTNSTSFRSMGLISSTSMFYPPHMAPPPDLL